MKAKRRQHRKAAGKTLHQTSEEVIKFLIQSRLSRDVRPEEEEAVSDTVQNVFQAIEERLESGNQKRSLSAGWGRWLRVAAIWLAVLTTGYICWEQWFDPYRTMRVTTGIGERRLVALNDGTKVWLGPQSTFRFPKQFKEAQREVNLSGEAFFEVAKDAKRTFVVHSGELRTQVLGTSFNIEARKDKGTASITVVTGKVAISRESQKEPQSMELQPNQRVLFNKRNQTLTREVYPQAPKLLKEREGVYEFVGTPVLELLERLKREYRIQVRIEGDVEHCKFHGALNAEEHIEQFLKKLCIVFNADWRKVDDHYVVTFQGCGSANRY